MGAVCAKSDKGRTTELPPGKAKKEKNKQQQLDAGGPRPIQPNPDGPMKTQSTNRQSIDEETPVKRVNSYLEEEDKMTPVEAVAAKVLLELANAQDDEPKEALINAMALKMQLDLEKAVSETERVAMVDQVAAKVQSDLDAKKTQSPEEQQKIKEKKQIVEQVAEKMKVQFTFAPGKQKNPHGAVGFSQELSQSAEAEPLEVEPRQNKLQAALKEAFTKPIIEEVAKQVIEGVNNAPKYEDDEELDEDLVDAVAQKLIQDLEKAAGARGTESSFRSNRESQHAVNEIMARVKQDMQDEEGRETLVDAVAQKVLKDLEEKEAAQGTEGNEGTENMSSTISQNPKIMSEPN